MSERVEQQLDQLTEEVARLYGQGRYEEAVDPATRACDLGRRELGEAHPRFATSLSDLAEMYLRTRRRSRLEPKRSSWPTRFQTFAAF
jgi:hypothetical protein